MSERPDPNDQGLVSTDLSLDFEMRKAGKDLFFGTLESFPISIKVLPGLEGIDLLFNIRHITRTPSAVGTKTKPPGALDALLQNKTAVLEIESLEAWLTLRSFPLVSSSDKLAGILKEALEIISEHGVETDGGRCHYCRIASVDQPRMIDGKVERICEGCFEKWSGSYVREHGFKWSASFPVLAAFASSILAGALVWACAWLSIEWFLEKFGAVVLPRLVIFAVVGGIGYGMGKTVGWLFSGIRGRGIYLPAGLAIIALVGGWLLGDLLQCLWMIHRIAGVWNPHAAVTVLDEFYKSIDLFGWFYRIGAGAFACCFAYATARPVKPKLDELRRY